MDVEDEPQGSLQCGAPGMKGKAFGVDSEASLEPRVDQEQGTSSSSGVGA